MTAGLTPADEGTDRLTVDREALIERWSENFGLDGPWDMRIAQQEAEHVAGLVEALRDAERERVIRDVERPDSPLCDCPRLENTPTNPKTKAAMDHHCDCRAIETAAIMLGAYSKTEHAKQCIHGTEMDLFYRPEIARGSGDR